MRRSMPAGVVDGAGLGVPSGVAVTLPVGVADASLVGVTVGVTVGAPGVPAVAVGSAVAEDAGVVL